MPQVMNIKFNIKVTVNNLYKWEWTTRNLDDGKLRKYRNIYQKIEETSLVTAMIHEA